MNFTIQWESQQLYMSWWLPIQLFYGAKPDSILLNLVTSSVLHAVDNTSSIDTQVQAMDYAYTTNKPLNVTDSLACVRLDRAALAFALDDLLSYQSIATCDACPRAEAPLLRTGSITCLPLFFYEKKHCPLLRTSSLTCLPFFII